MYVEREPAGGIKARIGGRRLRVAHCSCPVSPTVTPVFLFLWSTEVLGYIFTGPINYVSVITWASYTIQAKEKLGSGPLQFFSVKRCCLCLSYRYSICSLTNIICVFNDLLQVLYIFFMRIQIHRYNTWFFHKYYICFWREFRYTYIIHDFLGVRILIEYYSWLYYIFCVYI